LKITPLFNVEYLKNGRPYDVETYSYNEVLIETYALLKGVISNDLQ